MNYKELEELIEKERNETQITKGKLSQLLKERDNIYDFLQDPESGAIISGNSLFEKIVNLVNYYEDLIKDKE